MTTEHREQGNHPSNGVARMPWRCWYGDEWLELQLPEGWRITTHWPTNLPDIGQEGIEDAFDTPIGTPVIEELARRKRHVAIAVDDIARATPASRLLPALVGRLERAGVDPDRIRVVLAIGTHRPMIQQDIVKKLGEAIANRLAFNLNHPYDNVVDFGTSDRGTPIHICRYFAEADLRIGVGSIVPHGAPGFSGGAKVVIPGCAGIETIAAIHKPGRLKTGLLEIQNNEFRADIEQMVTEKVGLDCIVNGVLTAQRGFAGVFVGDPIAAHRAGVHLAKQAYATKMPDELVDVAICNAYPKDTDIHQMPHALYALKTSPRPVVKENGTIVIVTASPEGKGYHGIYGDGMRYGHSEGRDEERRKMNALWGASVVTYAPGLAEAEAKRDGVFRCWDDVVAHLVGRHGQAATVSVFPAGSLQIARESVLEAADNIYAKRTIN